MIRLSMVIVMVIILFFTGCEAPPEEVDEDLLPEMGRVVEALSVDGDSNDYPSESFQVAGADVHLAHDGNSFFVHLRVESEGWVAVGINMQNEGKPGSNMILGYMDDGTPSYRNDIGVGATAHDDTSVMAVEDFFLAHEDGHVIMEFSYPMVFPQEGNFNVDELVPGENYTMIVGLHDTSDDISEMHTDMSSIGFTVEP